MIVAMIWNKKNVYFDDHHVSLPCYPHSKTITTSTSWWFYPSNKNMKYKMIHDTTFNIDCLWIIPTRHQSMRWIAREEVVIFAHQLWMKPSSLSQDMTTWLMVVWRLFTEITCWVHWRSLNTNRHVNRYWINFHNFIIKFACTTWKTIRSTLVSLSSIP